MTLKCQPKASHFIDGEYIEDTDGTIIECIYPATGEKIAELHSATPKIVEMALKSAKLAQRSWSKLSGTDRGRILRKASDIIRERNRELSILETYDTGKPLQETLYVDATSGADALEYFGGLAGSITAATRSAWRRGPFSMSCKTMWSRCESRMVEMALRLPTMLGGNNR